MSIDSIVPNLLMSTGAISNIISNIVLFMFVMIIRKSFRGTLNNPTKFIEWLSILCLPLESIIIILTLYTYNYASLSTAIIVSILLLINIIIFHLFNQISKHYIQRQENQMLSIQNQAYENQFSLIQESIKTTNMLRHDMKNHFIGISELLNQNKIHEIKDYITEVYKYIDPTNLYVSTENFDVDSILNYKLKQIDRLGTEMSISVQLPRDIAIQKFDVNIILGNLLDNAIEALSKCTKRKFVLNINFEKNIIYINISNSFDGNFKKENNSFFTRKSNKEIHGIGLSSVKNTLEKYNGLMEISQTDNLFCVDLILHNTK